MISDFSYGGKFPNNPLKVTTFPEFEDMFYKEYKRRQQRLAQQKKMLVCAFSSVWEGAVAQ